MRVIAITQPCKSDPNNKEYTFRFLKKKHYSLPSCRSSAVSPIVTLKQREKNKACSQNWWAD